MKKHVKTDRPHFWQQPRFRYGSMSTLLLCVFLCVMVVLNLVMTSLEKKNGWRVDYSFNALTTQSDTTLDVLAQLPYPVHIYALYAKGQEDGPLLELLDRYAAASELITWEQTDVSLNPGLLTKFRGNTSDETVNNDSLIVYCEATNRWKLLSPADFYSLSLNYEEGVYEVAGLTYESKITSAISYVTQETIPRVMILQGHGELEQDGLAVLDSLLTSNNFEVCYFSLSDTDVELTSSDLLMILSPTRDFMDTELTQLMTFAGQGGRMFITCDYTDPVDAMPNYQALLRAYGVVPKNGVVVASTEERDTYYDSIRIDLIPYMQSTDATSELVSSRADTLLLTGARAFETPSDADQNLTTEVVLASGYKAYLRDLASGNLSLEQADEDELGPFALALLSRRITDQGNISRAFVLGCSTMLTSSQVYAMTDSQEFIIRMVEYLLDTQPVSLDIMAKTALRPQLSAGSITTGSLILIALPLTVLVAALIVLLPRRHK